MAISKVLLISDWCVYLVTIILCVTSLSSAQEPCLRQEPQKTISGVDQYRITTVDDRFGCAVACISDQDQCKAAVYHILPTGSSDCTLYSGNAQSPGARLIDPEISPGEQYYLYLLVEDCNLEGTLTEWGEWSDCSADCGDGQEVRFRQCMGGECEDLLKQTRICAGPCGATGPPTAPVWSSWNPWSPCDVTCGEGERNRNRVCTVEPGREISGCFGASTDTDACSGPPCVSAFWSQWLPWSICSRSCDFGQKSRNRICIGVECPGELTETEDCFISDCPEPQPPPRPIPLPSPPPISESEWNEWGSWSKCSVTCSGGVKTRTRSCENPLRFLDLPGCFGSATETESCNLLPCQLWTSWNEWGECSVTCGAGIYVRNRECTSGICDGTRDDSRPCDAGPCPVWVTWGSWSPCSVSCGNGVFTRARSCENGLTCVGLTKDTADCYAGPCLTIKWSEWGPWNLCTDTCQTIRTRHCNHFYGIGDTCVGENIEAKTCENGHCPIEEWGEWTHCSESCGLGERSRTRSCHEPLLCGQVSAEKQPCVVRSCSMPCTWSQWSSWNGCARSNSERKFRTRRCSCFGLGSKTCQGPSQQFKPCLTDPYSSGNLGNEWSSSHSHGNLWGDWSSSGLSHSSQHVWNEWSSSHSSGNLWGDWSSSGLSQSSQHIWSKWSKCTGTCGSIGEQLRTRTCMHGSICSENGWQTRQCVVQCRPDELDESYIMPNLWRKPCSQWSEWTPWSTCALTCGSAGKRSRARTCMCGLKPSTVCPGVNKEVKKCHLGDCPTWTEWGVWSACSSKCGLGQRTRIRSCSHGTLCDGNYIEKSRCRQGNCHSSTSGSDLYPTVMTRQCSWTRWTRWSQCSVTCGFGHRIRIRDCSCDRGCPRGNRSEDQTCVAKPCVFEKINSTYEGILWRGT